ncbi:MAG: hypothetical protein M1823_007287 [Watsoniomyces obsoletus]|nr:MAG: hypothetical protein M1823_007287 [Watsoniomyces obsoletus]
MLVTWTIRSQAIEQAEKAIESCRLRIAKETKDMQTLDEGKEKDKATANIEDVQDMVAEMEIRLNELRKPPVNVKEETQMKEQLSGLLGSMVGASAEEQKAALAKAAVGAADISGLVKKKKVKSGVNSGIGSAASTPGPEMGVGGSSGKVNGKRKVAFMEDGDHVGSGKKAKVEDAEDSGL